MAAKKRKRRLHPVAVFAITFMTVLSIGCGVLLSVYAYQNQSSAVMAEQTPFPEETQKVPERQVNLVDEMKAEALNTPDAPIEKPEEKVEERDVTLAFAGDILFDDNYSIMVALKQRENGILDCVSEELRTEMKNADICMLNNEFTYTTRGEPTPEKAYTFRAKPEHASMLHELGVDVVSIANNHTYDFGEVSLLDTLDTLTKEDILYAGAGRNLDEARAPVYFETGGMKIGIVAATQIERLDNPDTKGATENSAGVFRCWNPEKLLETVRETKENCDFVIVYIHWGTENTAELDWAQKDQSVLIAEAGADLIIGDHPHCLQPIDYVNGIPVVYSLGNFWFNSRTIDTCLIKATVNKEGVKALQFVPALQQNCTTTMLHGAEKDRVLNYMREISPNINIDNEGYITQK